MPLAILSKSSAYLGRALLGASRDLAPIIIVIALFQVLVLHQPFPDFLSILAGLGLVIVGLALFVVGLAMSPVPAANSGKVIYAKTLGIYGRTLIIDHGYGLFTMYAHLSGFSTHDGQMVKKGDIIGRTGNSGLSGGDHLHYSVLVSGTFVDPLEWWDSKWIHNNIKSKIDRLGQGE